jgi:hypothetical protein
MRRLLFLFSIVSVLAAGLPSAALAATDDTSVTLSGGTLAFTTAPTANNFAGVTLSGATQTLTTNFNDWRVSDARGSGAGWNVTIGASQFSDGAGGTLPASSLRLKAPAITAVDLLNLAAVPSLQGTPPWTIDAGSAVKVVSAAVGAGQGEWNFDHANLVASKDLELTIPANAAAGTYTSTITSTLATGP